MTTSWVIVDLATGRAHFETFSERAAKAINTKKYRAVPIEEYLGSLNRHDVDGCDNPGCMACNGLPDAR